MSDDIRQFNSGLINFNNDINQLNNDVIDGSNIVLNTAELLANPDIIVDMAVQDLQAQADAVISDAFNQVNQAIDNEIGKVVARNQELLDTFSDALDTVYIVEDIIGSVDNLAANFEYTADRFGRFFALPGSDSAINPLNKLNASDSPLPTIADSRLGQSQVSRLATGEETGYTAIARRDSMREISIPVAHSSASWSEPMASYAPNYPNNRVRSSARGIVEEMDDTPNNVRYHLYHPAGTYTEIDNNGTRTTKVVGDGFEIFMQNKSVFIRGHCNITIEGDANIKVLNSVHIEADGNAVVSAKNDVEVNARGKAFVNAKEEIVLKSDKILIEGKTLDFNIEEDITFKGRSFGGILSENVTFKCDKFAAEGKTSVIKSDTVDIQGDSLGFHVDNTYFNNSAIHAGASAAERVLDTGGDTTIKEVIYVKSMGGNGTEEVPTVPEARVSGRILPIGERANPVAPTFPDLPRTDRSFVNAVMNDEPDGQRVSVNTNASMGIPNIGYSPADVSVPGGNPGAVIQVDPSSIPNVSNIQPGLVLSRFITLADVTTNPAVSHHVLVAQGGLTAAQIAANLKFLSLNVIDRVFEKYGRGNVIITSAFRPPGGNVNSQHPRGQAVDFQFRDISRAQYAQRAAEMASFLNYDQLLFEYNSNGQDFTPWVHVSIVNGPNRRQFATINTAVNSFVAGRIVNPYGTPNVAVATNEPTDGLPRRSPSEVMTQV